MPRSHTTNSEVKKNNRNRIFRYICRHGQVSNPDIAYALQLSLPTVLQNTRELMGRGLVEEKGEMDSTGGRKAKALTAAADARLALGLDITRNHTAFLLTNLTGDILKHQRIRMPFANERRYYAEVNSRLESFLRECKKADGNILGLGISLPGVVNQQKKEITYSHVLEVEGVSFEFISGFFSWPCVFLNDANAGAYGEGIHLENDSRFFYLSLSNTVGGAVFSRGDLVLGEEFRCGEVGHMTLIPGGKRCYCGREGCVDVYCSAKRLSDYAEGKLENFFQELEQGNERIGEIFKEYLNDLSLVIHNIHMMLDCRIILGGYAGSYLEPYLEQLRTLVRRRSPFGENCGYISTCRYPVEAAAYGAAMNVVEKFMSQV